MLSNLTFCVQVNYPKTLTHVNLCVFHCEYQYQGRTIGIARIISNLYYFDDNLFSNKKALGFSTMSSNNDLVS